VAVLLEGYQDGAVKVLGKGNKEREVPLSPGARAAVDAWLTLRGGESGPLLLAVDKAGHVRGHGIVPQIVFDRLRYRAQQAGLALGCSPHDFRRTFITSLLAAGVDVLLVQQLVGHAKPETTSRYDRRSAAARAKAVTVLHFPYTTSGPKKHSTSP
jgi:site-specific recombinase XerD